ncbi:4-hydroxybenzoate polyprenyltransferase/phosphoserine phosphatase [Phyllobacterium myrsinacearum]|uniref:4-hydroxybenzoate polyprenyltransferase/phosphoserine phosphatase n=1 Tax=Phyllobacterium myrsinacearum TaxID=28101 RepID=A0A839EM95_9HYPH|nr:4-hydroxybenzoate polyprenyltransferase/phosphoserine phosphatase [Phyllobacterium myrsinacearum]
MSVQSGKQFVDLVVDLDGTLIATDLLWESIFQLLKQNMLYLFVVPFWALRGKGYLKHQIAERVRIDPALLPYRQDFLNYLREEHGKGRRIVLATGAARRFADDIAAHIGIFDAVYATDATRNLTSKLKTQFLIETFAGRSFAYAGNSRADIPVFEAAGEAIVVAPDRAAAKWQRAHPTRLFETPKRSWKAFFRMLRAHQWMKNTLIFVPPTLDHELTNWSVLGNALIAFCAFSAAASAIYIVNDLFDLPLDRQHARKKSRAFASGAFSIPFGLQMAFVLLAIAVLLATRLPLEFGIVLGVYIIATTAYSLALKRMLLIDVLMLAGLYTVRVLAGAAATQIEGSFWLLAFSSFFFLSLALVKRYVELQHTALFEKNRIAGRGYRADDREMVAQCGVASAFAAALVLALYVDSDSVVRLYSYPWMIWPLCPIVLYINIRIWILAHRGEMHEDPVVFLISDWRSQIMIAIGAALLLYGGARA